MLTLRALSTRASVAHTRPVARRAPAVVAAVSSSASRSASALGVSSRVLSRAPGLDRDRAMAVTRRRSRAAVKASADAPADVTPPGGPKINLPTALTLIRVAAVPLVTWIFYQPGAWVAPTCCAIFIAAAITDWADGYLARKMKLVSSFGAFLDPVADKLMVAAALVLLCTKTAAGLSAVSMAIPATIIIGREITMSAIREWAAAAGGEAHGAVAVNSYGKWKTATQLVALSILLGVRDGCDWLGLSGAAANYLVQGGVYCLYASAALALLSLYIYMAGVIKYMN